MATLSKGTTFASGDTVTATKLNSLVDSATISGIVNADVSASAAIDKTKISGTAITAADTGTVTNAMLAGSIAHTKLANVTAGSILLGNASNVPTATALSGDVTVNSSGVTAISSGVIVDADVNASAAIALSKLATGALPTAITVASANLVDGTIVNADINASAAIDISKLGTSTSAALGVGTVELGHASDTTLSRAAAGRLAVEGVNVVTVSSTDTLTNKTLTAPVISSITNTGTLTLPTSTDTLVGRATTDTLTNKTLTAPVISSITNTGTLTLPTSTDTLVGRATTDTLTNKSVALGSNTVTGTKAQFDTAVTDDNFAYTGTANSFTASQTVTGTVTAQAAATQDAVVLQGRAGGTSTRSVTLTPASLTASRTLTLPDTTGTVVTTGDTGTVTSTMIADGTIALANLVAAVANALVPVGTVQTFARDTAPTGWLAADGGTFGSASSGATSAAADYEALFTLLWANGWTDANLPILTSAGAASTRGASAAADWTANKRLTLPDLRGIFVRGSGSQTISGTSYSGTFAEKQQDDFKSHTHTVADENFAATSTPGGIVVINQVFDNQTRTTSSTGGTETRPANIALLYCIKF